ncbi:hypothetical protein ON010_g8619 [Phytophthora cinnamomi]|nr:hypothetical protein ON010_g8619 [Phytophthora cinnamomi]
MDRTPSCDTFVSGSRRSATMAPLLLYVYCWAVPGSVFSTYSTVMLQGKLAAGHFRGKHRVSGAAGLRHRRGRMQGTGGCAVPTKGTRAAHTPSRLQSRGGRRWYSCIKLAQLIAMPTCAIETLSLQGNSVEADGLQHLSLGLARSHKLVTLNLSDNGIRNNIEALTAFRDGLLRSKALANVDFTFNLIEPEGANILLPALAPVRSGSF